MSMLYLVHSVHGFDENMDRDKVSLFVNVFATQKTEHTYIHKLIS